MAEQSNIDEAIKAAKTLIGIFKNAISGSAPGSVVASSWLKTAQFQEQRLFDLLDQVAAELVTIDEEPEQIPEWEKQLLDPGSYIGHGVMTKKELAESMGIDYPSLFTNTTESYTYSKQVGDHLTLSTINTALDNVWNNVTWAHEPQTPPHKPWYIEAPIFGTYIAPTTFIPMSGNESDQMAFDESPCELHKPADLIYPVYTSAALPPFSPFLSTATVTTYADVVLGLNPNDILDVDGKTYVIMSMMTDGFNTATIELEELNGQFTKATKAMHEFADKLVYKQQKPWYAQYNEPKGKK